MGMAVGVVHGPPRLPVEHDGDTGADPRSQDLPADALQFLAQRADLAERPRSVAFVQPDDRSVELLASAAAALELEELHGVGAMRQRLVALAAHLPGQLHRVEPALLGG